MKTDYITQISNKLDDKKLYPIVSKVRKSYWKNFNTSQSLKENFIVWAVEVQKMPYPRIGEIFGIKKSQVGNLYHDAKRKLGGQS